MAVKIEPPSCAGPSCAPTIENALYSSDPFHFGNFRSCNMLQTFPVSPFAASLSQKRGGRGYWSYQLKFTAAGPNTGHCMETNRPASEGGRYNGADMLRLSGHGARATSRVSRIAGHWLLGTVCYSLLSPASHSSAVTFTKSAGMKDQRYMAERGETETASFGN